MNRSILSALKSVCKKFKYIKLNTNAKWQTLLVNKNFNVSSCACTDLIYRNPRGDEKALANNPSKFKKIENHYKQCFKNSSDLKKIYTEQFLLIRCQNFVVRQKIRHCCTSHRQNLKIVSLSAPKRKHIEILKKCHQKICNFFSTIRF